MLSLLAGPPASLAHYCGPIQTWTSLPQLHATLEQWAIKQTKWLPKTCYCPLVSVLGDPAGHCCRPTTSINAEISIGFCSVATTFNSFDCDSFAAISRMSIGIADRTIIRVFDPQLNRCSSISKPSKPGRQRSSTIRSNGCGASSSSSFASYPFAALIMLAAPNWTKPPSQMPQLQNHANS
jgi:hypothetical protein